MNGTIKLIIFKLALFLVVVNVTCAFAADGWVLTFQDEFNGSALDTDTWNTTYPGGGRTAGGNGEQEYYSDGAFSFPSPGSSGYLQINTGAQTRSYSQCLNGTCKYTSGLITTSGNFSQTYGYFEMRVNVPQSAGLWPAFWLLPYPVNYSNEPFEIDSMEIGYGSNGTVPYYHGSLHANAYTYENSFDNYNNYSDAYHVFAVDWEPGSIRYFIDPNPGLTNPVHTVTTNVPTSPAFILANMAIGGSWIGYPNSTSITAITNNTVPMQIDYIRVYQKSANGGYSTIPGPTPIPTIGGSVGTAPVKNLKATVLSSN